MNKTVFICEFVSGGGFNNTYIPSSLFCEGFAMLKSICNDFKTLGFYIKSIFDYRIQFLIEYLNIDKYKIIKRHDNFSSEFKEIAGESDYVFIIAPERDNILYELTKIVKNLNIKLLSNDLKAVKIGTSKIKTYQFFRNHNLPTPNTMSIKLSDISLIKRILPQHENPLVLKPNDGVGAEDVYLFKNYLEFKSFLSQPPSVFDNTRSYVVQEFISGKDMSVLLLGNRSLYNLNPLILGVNNQRISLVKNSCNLQYLGGDTPILDYKKYQQSLYDLFKKVNLSQFRSFYGIDFISTEKNDIFLIEINPRLTTSYIGIRNTINVNPVSLLMREYIHNKSLEKIFVKFHSTYMLLKFQYIGEMTKNKVKTELLPKIINNRSEIITPLISLYQDEKNKRYSCFVSTKCKDFLSSQKKLTELIKYIEEHGFKLIT